MAFGRDGDDDLDNDDIAKDDDYKYANDDDVEDEESRNLVHGDHPSRREVVRVPEVGFSTRDLKKYLCISFKIFLILQYLKYFLFFRICFHLPILRLPSQASTEGNWVRSGASGASGLHA